MNNDSIQIGISLIAVSILLGAHLGIRMKNKTSRYVETFLSTFLVTRYVIVGLIERLDLIDINVAVYSFLFITGMSALFFYLARKRIVGAENGVG